jgi:hypothetical protein
MEDAMMEQKYSESSTKYVYSYCKIIQQLNRFSLVMKNSFRNRHPILW